MFESESLQFFWMVVFGALVVEAVVNIIKNVEDKNREWKYWASLALGLILGVFVGVNYELDVFKLMGLEGQIPVAGAVLTGLIMSRGANIVSDLVGRINAWKVPG